MRLVYVTAKDVAEARTIGRALVERRVAACVNILPGMESIYHWEDKIETGHEAVLIVKTDAAHVQQVIAAVKELHSYSVPCALELPVIGGNPSYLSWLAAGVAV